MMWTVLGFLFLASGCDVDDGEIDGPYCDDPQFEDDPCKCFQVEGSAKCDDTGTVE